MKIILPFPGIMGGLEALLFTIKTHFLAITVRGAIATPQNRVNLFAKNSRLGHSNDKWCQILDKNALLFEMDWNNRSFSNECKTTLLKKIPSTYRR